MHAPPGGSSSIDIFGTGGNSESSAPAAKVPVAEELPPPAPTKEEEEAAPAHVEAPQAAPSSDKTHQVGVVVVEGVGSDNFIKAVKKSFAAAGINSLLFMPIADVALLTFAAQNLTSMCDVVVGGAILINDSIGANNGALSQTLVGGLIQLGLVAKTCVIPAVVSQESLLEAKAVLPALSERWANACMGALAVKTSGITTTAVETPSPASPVDVTLSGDDVDSLLTAFKESLKVILAHLYSLHH